MKKLLACLMAICLGISFSASAQSPYAKLKSKIAKKEYKQKVKEFKKGDWQVYGSSHTLEMELLNHYEALEKTGVAEIVGTARTTSPNIAQDLLTISASRAYAQLISGEIKGNMAQDQSLNISEDQLKEFEHFYSAYEEKLQAQVDRKLIPTFTIYRKITIGGKDAYEWLRFYILDESAAYEASRRALEQDATLRALEQAVKETALAQINAEQIHEYLKKVFEDK